MMALQAFNRNWTSHDMLLTVLKFCKEGSGVCLEELLHLKNQPRITKAKFYAMDTSSLAYLFY